MRGLDVNQLRFVADLKLQRKDMARRGWWGVRIYHGKEEIGFATLSRSAGGRDTWHMSLIAFKQPYTRFGDFNETTGEFDRNKISGIGTLTYLCIARYGYKRFGLRLEPGDTSSGSDGIWERFRKRDYLDDDWAFRDGFLGSGNLDEIEHFFQSHGIQSSRPVEAEFLDGSTW